MALDGMNNNLPPINQKRSGLLRDQVQLVKRKDCDRYEIAPIPELLSFEKGFFVVIRACQLLTQKMDGVILVGIAGPSGAGKTVFTEKMLSFMPSIVVISMDNYNDSSRVIDGNFDDPRLTDYKTLLENINGLKSGKPVDVPVYDFKQSCRTGYRKVEVPSSRIVILEGIYALSEKLRPFLDLRVSVTGGVHFDLVKRVLRDIHRVGQEPEEIIHQISETVYPMYKAYIEPDLQTAQIKIKNKFNPFSGFQSPTYILKSSQTLTEDQIKTVISPNFTATTEETYDIYLLPPGEDPESCQSYLRMRNRDGKYSLMFEEWVTDNPFIISPRITFEVSVRLLGGLMALGYTIATILKRHSRVFSDSRVCVKIDRLEQLNRKYSQVQGKERAVVRDVAKQLGLEGHYIPRTYIEQIQLEKLMKEVIALPEDLKTKLSIDEDFVASPRQNFLGTFSPKPSATAKFSKSLSWTRNAGKDISVSELVNRGAKQTKIEPVKLPGFHSGNKSSDRGADSPTSYSVLQGQITQLSEQLSTLNERLDELLVSVERLDARIGPAKGSSSQKNSIDKTDSSAMPAPSSLYPTGVNNTMNGSLLPASISTGQLSAESTLLEEVALLVRGQQKIGQQLDILGNVLRDKLESDKYHYRKENQQYFSENIIKSDAVIVASVLLSLSAIGVVLIKGLQRY